jgi:hypothetical protein
MKNTYTFDLGIPGWAEQYPAETILLGKPIPESSVKFIPKSEFKKKTLAWDDFVALAGKPGVVVVDTRDPIQKGFMSRASEDGMTAEMRAKVEEFRKKNKEMIARLGKRKVRPATFDQMLKFIINNKRYNTQKLLIFDQVGKQVRWLMYRLEEAGLHDYYFLKGGAVGVIGTQLYN